MLDQVASRRSVIGAVAVGTAAIGTLALLDRGGADQAAANDRIKIVPGGGRSGFQPVAHEMEGLAAEVGAPVRIAGETGGVSATIDSVVPLRAGGRHPAGMRAQPFMVRLAMDPGGAPAGDRIYALSRPLAGLHDVFLTRGADVGGKAILVALFA